TLKEDIQIGDTAYRAEKLGGRHSLYGPLKKTRIPWRDLQPVEGGHCIYTNGSKRKTGLEAPQYC
ncbi:hypothetical protein CEXT_537461, partial [Caerostris extrusa]